MACSGLMYPGVPMPLASSEAEAASSRFEFTNPSVAERSIGARFADHAGHAPVDDVGLAVFSQHDVIWLQVAVQHTATVGVGHGVAHVDDPLEQANETPGCDGRVATQRVFFSWSLLMALRKLSPRTNRMA